MPFNRNNFHLCILDLTKKRKIFPWKTKRRQRSSVLGLILGDRSPSTKGTSSLIQYAWHAIIKCASKSNNVDLQPGCLTKLSLSQNKAMHFKPVSLFSSKRSILTLSCRPLFHKAQSSLVWGNLDPQVSDVTPNYRCLSWTLRSDCFVRFITWMRWSSKWLLSATSAALGINGQVILCYHLHIVVWLLEEAHMS